jgi:hypothetical protein
VLVSFFFWKPAQSRLQKSIPGLTRTLLQDILKACPELVQYVYPEDWDRLNSMSSPHAHHRYFGDADVDRGFLALLNQDDFNTNYRLCIFINALDEHEGTDQQCYSDMVDVFNSWIAISRLPNKQALSSAWLDQLEA